MYHTFQIHKHIILICLSGFLIRLWMALVIPLSFDEAHNILLARSSIFPLKISVANAYPPLFFSIWHLWQKVSDTLVWNRLLAVGMGTTTIFVTYIALKKMFSHKVAIPAALLTAIIPGHVYYSSVARMYAPGMLFATLFCSYMILYTKEKRLTVGFFLVTLAGLYTHYYFSILWLLTLVWVLIHFRHNIVLIQPWLKFSGLIITLLSPLIYQITQTSPLIGIVTNPILKFPAFYITPVVPWDIILHLPIIGLLPLDMLSVASICIALIGIFFLIMILARLSRLAHFHSLAFAFFMAPVLIFFLLQLGLPIAGLRSFAIFFPCFLFLAGAAITHLTVFKQRVLLILITLFSVFFLGAYTILYTGAHDPMNTFYQELSSKDTVVYSDIILYLPVKVIKPKGEHYILHPGYLDQLTLNTFGVTITPYARIQPASSLWYVKQHTNWAPFDENANKIEAFFDEKFIEIARKQFNSFEIVHYETHP